MHRNMKIAMLLVGSNALTFVYTAVIAGRLMKQDRDLAMRAVRTAEIHRDAVLRFVNSVPPEVSHPIIRDMEFKWVVRDLVDD